MRIKLMPDYRCHALWWDGEPGRIGNVEPGELGLSAALEAALDAWARRFDAGLDWNDPGNTPPPTPEEAAAFDAEGRALAARVQAELGPGATVRWYRD
jgi:hypothetical protein